VDYFGNTNPHNKTGGGLLSIYEFKTGITDKLFNQYGSCNVIQCGSVNAIQCGLDN
jgi:hypothetical protein